MDFSGKTVAFYTFRVRRNFHMIDGSRMHLKNKNASFFHTVSMAPTRLYAQKAHSRDDVVRIVVMTYWNCL